MSFLLASQIVRPIDHYSANSSADIPPPELEGIRSDIRQYMLSNAIPAAALFLLVAAYFPSAPSSPPSLSSGHDGLDFISGFRDVVRNKAACLCFGAALSCKSGSGLARNQ